VSIFSFHSTMAVSNFLRPRTCFHIDLFPPSASSIMKREADRSHRSNSSQPGSCRHCPQVCAQSRKCSNVSPMYATTLFGKNNGRYCLAYRPLSSIACPGLRWLVPSLHSRCLVRDRRSLESCIHPSGVLKVEGEMPDSGTFGRRNRGLP